MNNYSKENIKRLYSFIEINPNKRMHPNGYRVLACDCNDGGPDECFIISEHIFSTKADAWLYFQKDLQEYGTRDFWDGVDWNDEMVVSKHYDEKGWTHTWIEKWTGFDDDIQVTWDYEGRKYKSLEALWEGEPIFIGSYMETDRPVIVCRKGIAKLDITLGDSFKNLCEKRREEEKKEREQKKEREKLCEILSQNKEEDLPF